MKKDVVILIARLVTPSFIEVTNQSVSPGVQKLPTPIGIAQATSMLLSQGFTLENEKLLDDDATRQLTFIRVSSQGGDRYDSR